MKILVTGYNGFLGSHLTVALREHELIGVDLYIGNSVSRHLGWAKVGQIEKVDCIIHLAGKAHDTAQRTHEQEYYDVNVGLTEQIYQAFLQSKSRKFIFVSSVKAVADAVSADCLTEEAIPNPSTPYGKSKLAAESYILNAGVQLQQRAYILRPCMIHGPENKGNLNLLYKVVERGIPYPLGGFDNLRSFTSIQNFVFLINEIVSRSIEPGIYHVCDDEPVATTELIRLVAESLHRKARIWNLPKALIQAIAAAGDLLHLPLNGERLRKMTESFVVSNKKIKNAIGIDRLPISARDGLLHTFRSFSKQ
ncbi:NAD-dependent epimerase/dehydratase family protein [bacterium]|nr:MAG: NAD-dependent epimerase/dehydratase family protein [bacterium]